MKIELLGTNCPKCRQLESNLQKALAGSGLEYRKITDVPTILSYGIFAIPALFLDGKLQLAGELLAVEELKNLIDYKPGNQ